MISEISEITKNILNCDDYKMFNKLINSHEQIISKLISNDSLFNNLNNASKSIDLLLEDIRLNPKRYIHFSIFGKKNKPFEKNND